MKVIPGQTKTAKVADGIKATTDGESKKPLSKRQKWRLKCRAKRLRRRERKNSTSESTGKEGKGEAKRTNAYSAATVKLPTDNKKQLLDDVSAPTVNDRNHIQTHKLVKATVTSGSGGGGVGSRKVKVQKSDAHPGVKLSRKRKRKGVESSMEEAEFAEMVAKYRRKLQRTSA